MHRLLGQVPGVVFAPFILTVPKGRLRTRSASLHARWVARLAVMQGFD